MRFWPFHRRSTVSEPPVGPLASRAWHETGVAEEVAAFLDGRLVDRLVATRQTVPGWAALNRLAHVDHAELVHLVAGGGLDPTVHPFRKLHAWAEQERFLAARLLATSGATPDGLVRIQHDALIPLELSLIERSKAMRLRPENVLDAGAEALDSHQPGA
jgi:hypothetical protein